MLADKPEVRSEAMGGAREGLGRGQVGLRRKALLLFAVLALAALVVGSIFGDKGLLEVWEQRRRTEALAHEVDELRAENARLSEQIRALRSDERAIERLAREQLGLARPGETVFLVTGPGDASRP
jgi:cell division protein FtsB